MAMTTLPQHTFRQRLIAFSIATSIGLILAFALGYTAWVLAKPKKDKPAMNNFETIKSEQSHFAATAASPIPSPSSTLKTSLNAAIKPTVLAPAGELYVAGGEITTRSDAGNTAKRHSVAPFFIGETEVTNEQYYAFVQEAGYRPPNDWVDRKFLDGTAEYPVTNVNLADANAYCKWLSREIGATARLPTEAEWELAGGGVERYFYPWGNEWDENACGSKEDGATIQAVKSHPSGQSPVGAFDMVGNVWEWTADAQMNANGIAKKFDDGDSMFVIKGGSAKESRKVLSIQSREAFPSRQSSSALGFRYVVVRQNDSK